eukprot:TRINITY_DN7721_c0_g1_i4.p1 TRINITY_DN7721_c0_g1~~TRINITY_DN7721_c0_g1_i4.p1  ORF type:complete len:168 (+),score=54.70 TRINITY_DN7721_c0_g1_i4:104-607(+)
MIRRPPRSTLSSSSAASDVYKRQYQRRVRGLRLLTTLHGAPLMDAEHRVGSRKDKAPEVEGGDGLGPNERRAYTAAMRTDEKRRKHVEDLEARKAEFDQSQAKARDPVKEEKMRLKAAAAAKRKRKEDGGGEDGLTKGDLFRARRLAKRKKKKKAASSLHGDAEGEE